MVIHPVLVGLSLVALLASCAGPALPYRPEKQPLGARVSADYSVGHDVLRVVIDTGGRSLEDTVIVAPDGAAVRAETIEYPPIAPPSSAVQFGLGFGGGRFGHGSGFGVGTGVSVATPIGEGQATGPTVATFPLDAIGPGPWRLRVKLTGVEEAVIVLGGLGQRER
jgi:hypothetical protein